MEEYLRSIDFSDFKPWSKAIDSLDYSFCATCGKIISNYGTDRCYECEFKKPHITRTDRNVMRDIHEAISLLDRRDL